MEMDHVDVAFGHVETGADRVSDRVQMFRGDRRQGDQLDALEFGQIFMSIIRTGVDQNFVAGFNQADG